MSRFSKLELIHHILSSPEPQPEPSFIFPKPSYTLLTPFLFDDVISPFHDVTTITDLITPPFTTRRLITTTSTAHLYLQSLSDRVSALELAFDLEQEQQQKKSKAKAKAKALVDRKYTWTAEIKSGEVDRKYKLTTEIKGGGNNNKKKESKWTAEIKSKKNGGQDVKKYTFTASTGESNEEEEEVVTIKKKDVNKKKEKRHRIVEIQGETDNDHGTLLLKQAFDRSLERRNKGKKKELSPQDAAMVIQMTFREYLVRRSQSLRALRELAVAKGKLKELRGLFNNFSYRRKVARDAEERQKFSEKVIVLLLTVDAIEGADIMVRAAKRSMVDELEAMLDVVDPQPGGSGGRSLSMKRRTFDMPDGVIQKELAAGVAQVVRMLGENPEETFEACL